MPGGDRKGPWGLGPRTGRAAGYCTGHNIPGYIHPGFARSFGFGRGQGRGFGRGFWGRGRGFWRQGLNPNSAPYYPETYPEPNKDEEKAYLEHMIKDLEEEMNMIRQRLQEMSKEKKEAQQ